MGYNSNIFLLMPKSSYASKFITVHETATGLSMGTVQQNSIKDLFNHFSGIGTPNNSNLLGLFLSQAVLPRIWIYCPSTDSIASSAGYNIELLTQTTLGTFNNFVSGDFTVNGVIGGASKWFGSGVAPSNYPQNAHAFGVYCRTNSDALTMEGGTNNTYALTRYLNNIRTRQNDGTTTQISNSDSRGLFIAQRSGTSKQFYKNGVSIFSSSIPTTVLNATEFYFHAQNTCSAVLNSARQLSLLTVGLPVMTANEHDDFYYAIQQYQTNVITGGRQV